MTSSLPGHKRKLSWVRTRLRADGVDVDKIDAEINDIVIKTLFSCDQSVRHSYRAAYPNHVGGSACVEILGFDIMLDDKLRPWLLEVNRSPSFSCDSQLDAEIKHGVLRQSMRMLNLKQVIVIIKCNASSLPAVKFRRVNVPCREGVAVSRTAWRAGLDLVASH